MTRIGVDETSFQKRHEYVTFVCDLDGTQGGVLCVADDRKEVLRAFPAFVPASSQRLPHDFRVPAGDSNERLRRARG